MVFLAEFLHNLVSGPFGIYFRATHRRSAVLSEEHQAGCVDPEFETAVGACYQSVNPQTALAVAIDHSRMPHLSKLASINNRGLCSIVLFRGPKRRKPKISLAFDVHHPDHGSGHGSPASLFIFDLLPPC